MRVTFVANPGFYVTEYGIDNVRVEAATSCARSGLRMSEVTVDDSPAGWGNGNGTLEPGETARLTVELLNDGSTTAFAPSGTLESSAGGVLIHEATAEYPDVPSGGSAVNLGAGFSVTLPTNTGCGATTVFEFSFTDAAGTVSRASWSPESGYAVTEIVFEDDFETDQGWIVDCFFCGGIFQRGDPVGTSDGSNPVNPEDDSPNDPGTFCYVTENGLPGGDPDATDVDRRSALHSPLLDLTAYKRARLIFDLWYYDSKTSPATENTGSFGPRVEGDEYYLLEPELRTTNGWESRTLPLETRVAMTDNVRLTFEAVDQCQGTGLPWCCPDCTSDTVEMGVDNVLVEGDLQVCDPLGVGDPPNGIGDTLRVNKSAGSAEIVWQASPVDTSHDGAAYYELFVSFAPDGGFSVGGTATVTTALRPPAPMTEFYKLVAVNPAGTSGDEPAP